MGQDYTIVYYLIRLERELFWPQQKSSPNLNLRPDVILTAAPFALMFSELLPKCAKLGQRSEQ